MCVYYCPVDPPTSALKYPENTQREVKSCCEVLYLTYETALESSVQILNVNVHFYDKKQKFVKSAIPVKRLL